MSKQGCEEEKENGQILHTMGKGNDIATSAKLLDITHESYGLNADLI